MRYKLIARSTPIRNKRIILLWEFGIVVGFRITDDCGVYLKILMIASHIPKNTAFVIS